MSIIKFNFPSDAKILQDIDRSNQSIKFIGARSVNQSLNECVFTRVIHFNEENVNKKITYKKIGFNWGFQALESVNL